MVRMLLPFTMGNVTDFNKYTYEHTIDHPILQISSSFAIVKPEIRKWVIDTFGFCHSGFDCGDYFIDFKTDEDMALFMMKWL